jgi:hypothetical protein
MSMINDELRCHVIKMKWQNEILIILVRNVTTKIINGEEMVTIHELHLT